MTNQKSPSRTYTQIISPGHSAFLGKLEERVHIDVAEFDNFNEQKWHVFSDATDADGLGSQISFVNALKLGLNYAGNDLVKVETTRVADFHPDPTNDQSFEFYVQASDADTVFVSDSPTLNVPQALAFADEFGFRLTISDHHDVKTKPLDERYLNPYKQGIEGGTRLGCGAQSAEYAEFMRDGVIRTFGIGSDKIVKQYRSMTDLLEVIGLAGSKADQQEKTSAIAQSGK